MPGLYMMPTSPIRSGNEGIGGTPPAAGPTPPNVLSPMAVRASGPSQGFDPGYLQNLATAIGGLFSNQKQGGNVMNVNPMGNLSDISPNSNVGGNSPTLGLPQTWLQQALSGGGFAYPGTPTQGTQNPVMQPDLGLGKIFNPRQVVRG
jgi:hypothetical protein